MLLKAMHSLFKKLYKVLQMQKENQQCNNKNTEAGVTHKR